MKTSQAYFLRLRVQGTTAKLKVKLHCQSSVHLQIYIELSLDPSPKISKPKSRRPGLTLNSYGPQYFRLDFIDPRSNLFGGWIIYILVTFRNKRIL